MLLRLKVFLLISFSFLWSKDLTLCYQIFFWFLPVAESCSTYSLYENSKVRLRSWAKTIVVGRLVKPVNSEGEVLIEKGRPKRFWLFQREGDFHREHLYVFKDSKVYFRLYRPKKNRLKEGTITLKSRAYDPFSASLVFYASIPSFEEKTITIFYEGKLNRSTFKTTGSEKVEVYTKVYDTWKTSIFPNIKTKGFLRPKGEWIVWNEKENLIPVLLKLSFNIGSVWVYLKEVHGDPKVFREILNSLKQD